MAANPNPTMTSLNDIRLIDIPKIHDAKGNLSVVEGPTLPFEIKRVYYLYDVPSTAERYGNAHKLQQRVLIALSGSFEITLKDGKNEKVVTLNKPNQGLYIPNGIWREMRNFSSGSVCLVIASDDYDESDYLREFEDFQSFKNRTS
ncbi:sugar 3,4-ketoisomerase [Flavobacterium sp.]|uniref:sugar 3,4-ketoisomerase n=1 Tax=Flavobacterium sp. TaxID=239 RepID=UPI0039E2D11B